MALTQVTKSGITADANYSGTTSGSPTVDTSSVADYTILIYNGSGTYTA